MSGDDQLGMIDFVEETNDNQKVYLNPDDGISTKGIGKALKGPAKIETNIVVVCSACGTPMQSRGPITGGLEYQEIDGKEYEFTVREDLLTCEFDNCPNKGTVKLHANPMMRFQDPEKVIENRKIIGNIQNPFHDVIRVEDEIGGPHFVTTTESLSSTKVDGERVDILEETSHIELADK